MNNDFFELVKCCICNNEDFTEISNVGKFDLPTHVVICNTCGLAQLNPRWTAEKYNDFYTNSYDNYYREAPASSKNIKIINYRFKKFNQYPANVKRVLDIGAGTGVSLSYLKKNVFPEASFYAIEPSASCQEVLKKKGIPVIANVVEEDWGIERGEKFDIIIMRHVVEHLLNPPEILKKIGNSLSDEGVFYFAVPNALNPGHPVRNNHFRNVHTYYFNRYSLENLLRISGLESKLIKEGDIFLPIELFGFLKKGNGTGEPVFRKEMIEKQKEFYLKRLDIEKRFTYRLYKFFKHRFHKYSGLILLLLGKN